LNAYSGILDLAFTGGLIVAQDVALTRGWRLEAISDEAAELDRVKRASCDEYSAFDRPIPYAPRLVRCAGLKAIEPSAGGDLKRWMAARIARLWRRRGRRHLFEYLTKTSVRLADGSRGHGTVLKTQRWETRDFVDLEVGDSAPHRSGIGGGARRGVAGPRKETPETPPGQFTNHALDFGENA
jgi:hypothetical protein